jgi:thioesterase domain-containing protein
MLNVSLPEGNLTRRQLLIWLEQTLDPDVETNANAALFRIAGPIDADRLRRAFGSVVERSDALRTRFEEMDGCPFQSVAERIDFDLDVVDLSVRKNPEHALLEWFDDRRQRSFALEQRAFDSALVRLGDASFVWYLRQHNLIADAWSFSLVYRRTLEAYTDLALAPLPRFSSYVERERAHSPSPACAASQSYWGRKLLAPLDPLRLYGRTARPKAPFLQRRTVVLSDAQADVFRRRATEHAHRSFTPPVSMLAAWMALLFAYLHRIGEARRIAIGAPLLNRPSKASRETIGRFADMGSFRLEIAEGETFGSLLEKTNQEAYETFLHAHNCAGRPAFDRTLGVSLNVHNATFPSFAGLPTRTELWPGVVGLAASRRHRVANGRAGAADVLVVSAHDFDGTGTPSLSFDFNGDVFDASMRDDAIADFMDLFDAFLEDPRRPVGQVELASVSMRRSRTIDLARPKPRTSTPASLGIAHVLDDGSPIIRRPFEAPADDLELKLAAIWQELLGVERVGRHDDFFDIGGHSLLALQASQRMKLAFGQEVTLRLLFECPTVASLASALSTHKCTAGPVILSLQKRGARPPVFFVCGIQIYYELARELGPSQPSYGMFLPVEEQILAGPDDGPAPIITVERMAASYLELVRGEQPHGPYCLAGLSFGGILAFEIAHQLRDRGEQVALLGLFDSVLPRAKRRRIAPWLASHVGALSRFDFSRLRKAIGAIVRRGSGVATANGSSGWSHQDRARARESIYTRAMLDYESRMRPFAEKATFFRAAGRVTSPGWSVDSAGGWADLVTGGLDVVEVPGDHMGIMRRPGVELIAQALRARLSAI